MKGVKGVKSLEARLAIALARAEQAEKRAEVAEKAADAAVRLNDVVLDDLRRVNEARVSKASQRVKIDLKVEQGGVVNFSGTAHSGQ